MERRATPTIRPTPTTGRARPIERYARGETHVRQRNPAGCTASRIDADLLDKAVSNALLELLANTDLVIDALAAAQEERAGERQRQLEEAAKIAGQITAAEASIDRYLTAFENGTLDEQTCGRRVRDLKVKIDQLRARQEETNEEDDADQLTAEDIDRARKDLEEVLTNGENGERKAIINAHVAEIKINGHQLIPVFMIPTQFRTLGQVVGRQGLEP